MSGRIICQNDPINKVDPTGENIGALTSVPVIDVIVGIPSIVGTLGSVGLIVAVAAVPMAMKEMVAPGPSIEASEPWEVDSSTCLAEAAAGEKSDKKLPQPASPGKLQKEVEKGRAPIGVDSVHGTHTGKEEPHIHYDDGTSSTQSGKIHDKKAGVPNPSNQIRKWIKKWRWTPPSKQ